MASVKRNTECKVCGYTRYKRNFGWNDETENFDLPIWECNGCGTETPRQVRKPKEGMTPSQEKAIEYLRKQIIGDDYDSKYPRVIERFETTPAGYGNGYWVSARTAQSEEGNLLHALSTEYWHVFVGSRGKLDAHQFPKSYEQFEGTNTFGINIIRRSK